MRRFLKAYLYHICFGIGLCLQLFHTGTYFTCQGSDRNLQILAGINLLEGHGYTVQEASTDDLSQTVYSPLKGWPPGYSVLFIPFYLLTGDIILSAKILAYLAVVLCFSAAHFLMQALRDFTHPWVYPAFFLGWGIFFTPFHYTAVADEWALGLFLWGSVFWFKIWVKPDGKWLLWMLGGAVFFWLTAMMRYAYYPVVLVPIAMTAVDGFIQRKINLRMSLITVMISLISFVSLWLISTPMVGTVDSLTDVYAQNTVYWENLAYMDAFPVKAFFYLSVEGIANKLGGITPVLGILLKIGMLMLSLFLLSLLVFRDNWKKGFDISIVPALYLIILTGIITSMLVFLSLKAPAVIYGEFIWTHVRETRFYAPLLVGFQILFWHLFFENRLGGLRKWGLRLLVITGISYSLLHATYRYGQRYIGNNYRETRYAREDQQLKALLPSIEDLGDRNQLVWVHEAGIYAEDEAAVVRWEGYRTILMDSLIIHGYSQSKTDYPPF
jgi:hypothetical protein